MTTAFLTYDEVYRYIYAYAQIHKIVHLHTLNT